jgi:hypothetical protein
VPRSVECDLRAHAEKITGHLLLDLPQAGAQVGEGKEQRREYKRIKEKRIRLSTSAQYNPRDGYGMPEYLNDNMAPITRLEQLLSESSLAASTAIGKSSSAFFFSSYQLGPVGRVAVGWVGS